MKMVNFSDQVISCPDLGLKSLAPGEVCEVPDAYCLPRQKNNGAKRTPIIYELCPQLKPYSTKYVPQAEQPRHRVTAEELIAQGWTPGEAALVERFQGREIVPEDPEPIAVPEVEPEPVIEAAPEQPADEPKPKKRGRPKRKKAAEAKATEGGEG